jgi:UDP-N-acetylmuramate--alanine ligase
MSHSSPSPQLIPGQRIHIVGIGGFGMSAIARILLEQGYAVSGSDRNTNALTQALAQEGATIYARHDAMNVQNAEIVIISSAIETNHIEVLSAEAQGIPVYKRQQIISALMAGSISVCIAGTHGKTTTSAMTTHVLSVCGQDPSYIVGGVLANSGKNASVGKGRAFVIEADEYDNMFHGLSPQIAVLNNIEYDHPDFFKTPDDMMESFALFVGLLPRDGLLVACYDDPSALIFARNRQIVNLPCLTYGLNAGADWQAYNLRHLPDATLFEVDVKGERKVSVRLSMAGEHNVQNALAALIVADSLGVPLEDAAQALASFVGTGRRFELRADINQIAVIDDYAHHPTAIRKTLHAARQRYPERQLWAVWQPHTYSRTLELLAEYLDCFEDAHHVVITEIYPSREKVNPGIYSDEIVGAMLHPSAYYASSLEDAARLLLESVKAPAVILIMSAGDAPRIGELVVSVLQAQA